MSIPDIKKGEVSFKKSVMTKHFVNGCIVSSSIQAQKGNLLVSMALGLIKEGETFDVDKSLRSLGLKKEKDVSLNYNLWKRFEKQGLDENGKIVTRMDFAASKGLYFVTIIIGEVSKDEIGTVDLYKLLEDIGYVKEE